VTKKTKVTKSSGNVFQDLGLSNPEERLAKAGLAIQISKIIKASHLNQVNAGELLGINQPKVSALLSGNLAGFSTDRLIRFLNLLGRDVDIIIKEKSVSRKYGHVHVISKTKAQ